MSRYYVNYPQYLGAQKCCDLRTQGPAGPQGPQGPPGGVGDRGWTGPAGQSFTGPTGRDVENLLENQDHLELDQLDQPVQNHLL